LNVFLVFLFYYSLIGAEDVVLQNRGNVLRLAGLYNKEKGPHMYWKNLVEGGKLIAGSPNDLINLIHYEDAASLAVAVLSNSCSSKAFLGVDDTSDSNRMTKEFICHLLFKGFSVQPKVQSSRL
jgi:nucleoside-diphosphate-sugar epimerase